MIAASLPRGDSMITVDMCHMTPLFDRDHGWWAGIEPSWAAATIGG
jgi:hypothetical protein